MNSIAKLTAVSLLALVATGCAGNTSSIQAKAEEALATAKEAKEMALQTQNQLDARFKKSRYK